MSNGVLKELKWRGRGGRIRVLSQSLKVKLEVACFVISSLAAALAKCGAAPLLSATSHDMGLLTPVSKLDL